ncbi:TELO2-interacting protein 1-like protein [Phytophthora ramorum]|uniref:TELO2-interacting protein 1-like protein n=1 Tax=Phytophthora ramorum TaxID=164328 RepID=UPI0030A6E9A5|nr:TELO2-interacting protein 1-like protein [Phytophthora ramorum]
MEVATYVELCTRLSRFVQLHPTDDNCKEMQGVLDDLVALYDRVDLSAMPAKLEVDAPLVGFAAMDDLVLLSMHKLLGTFVLSSASVSLQERSFVVFSRVLRRCKLRVGGINAGQLQRRLSFVQSCVVYLPPPPEASDEGEDVPGSVVLAAQPEELRLAILKSLCELLGEEVLLKENQVMQFQIDQQHFFAYLVASLLYVAQRDRCREAALQAVEVLKRVLVFVRDPQTLRQYLPGVAAGLWKSANAPQQASKVIVAALQCLATALDLCIGDDHLPEGGALAKQQFTLEAIRHSVESNAAKKSAWEEQSSKRGTSKTLVSQRALMVESVGVCAEILGAEFKLFLLHVLYPLVEQLGSHNVEVERAALAALEKVQFFTGYDSIEALFQANMDYFVDALCARLEQLDTYPMTAFVVEALLRHTRLASLPLVDEVASSLLRSVDLYQDSPHVDGLLRALKHLLGSIAQDAEESEVRTVPVLGDDRMEKELASRSLLKDFIHEMKVLTNDGIDALNIEEEIGDEEKQAAPEQPEPPSVKGAMPLEYDEVQTDDQDDSQAKDDTTTDSGYRTLVIDIMDRCGYFLVDSDPIACCLVLSLVDEGVRFLSRHQKQLLPLVARMWPELLPRLRVDNRAIVTGTVRVVATLAEVAGDFVGDRFVETVWPILRSQIQSIDFGTDAKSQLTRSMLLISKPLDEASNTIGTGESGKTETSTGNELSAVNGMRKTQEIRQLLAILTCLTVVCRQSESVTQLVPEITRACSKYLSRAAPREVVEQTSELFAALVQLNGDHVFCTVAALADWVPPTPPSARFSGYEPDAVQRFYRGHLSAVSGQTQSCRDNALILMNRLFS